MHGFSSLLLGIECLHSMPSVLRRLRFFGLRKPKNSSFYSNLIHYITYVSLYIEGRDSFFTALIILSFSAKSLRNSMLA